MRISDNTGNNPKKKYTYCFDALMKDRFVDEVEFAKFPDEFNVAKHLDLGNGTLLLLLRSKRVVMFVIDWWGEQRTKTQLVKRLWPNELLLLLLLGHQRTRRR